MFERYTEKALRAIFFARYEASQLGSNYIESEHLLLGLLRETKTLDKLFRQSHAAVDTIRKRIEGRSTSRTKISTSIDLALTEECQRILVHAAEEAECLGHRYIGTEHLFLGSLREPGCFAAQLLQESGVAIESARTQIASETCEELSPPRKSPGIPAGYSWRQLLYNPASKTIIVEMRSPAVPPLPSMARLFTRKNDAVAYEPVGDPEADVSYQNPVTCEKQPIVIFNSIKWNTVAGGGDWDGLFAMNLSTKEITACVPKDRLAIPEPHLRSWISALVAMSDDGQRLYVNVAIEKACSGGAVVHYYLASLELADKKLDLLSQLKDLRF